MHSYNVFKDYLLKNKNNILGDLWGGLAATMVALPSAIAFGATIYGTMGRSYAAQGAIAGVFGVISIGFLASLFGGTKRLISAPCAPAVAVLTAFILETSQNNINDTLILRLIILSLLAGLFQVFFGIIRLGRLIKYMPYPVVSGYLSGVGLYIILSQIPKLLGLPKNISLWQGLYSLDYWKWPSLIVGTISFGTMFIAPKLIRTIPAAILSLTLGILVFQTLGFFNPSFLIIKDNSFVIGLLPQSENNILSDIVTKWFQLKNLTLRDIQQLILPALTLAILLSIDTLKTCLVLDTLTGTRHDSNQELLGQGIGNLSSALIGGIPGAGTIGATMINMSSGGNSRLSGLSQAIFALLVFLLLNKIIAWVPIASLAAILIFVGFKMIDVKSILWLKSKTTILDFCVIFSVITVALSFSMIAASATGIILTIFLFLREQIKSQVIHRKVYGDNLFSKTIRQSSEMKVLKENGKQTVIIDLQGSLFFGTTDQLYSSLDAELKKSKDCKYIILNFRRVLAIDMTIIHMLELVIKMIAERDGIIFFTNIPQSLPNGMDIKNYFNHTGLSDSKTIRLFDEVDEALELIENKILEKSGLYLGLSKKIFDIHDIELFKDRKEDSLINLESYLKNHHAKASEIIFEEGDEGKKLFFIRRGEVRITISINDTYRHHISTFGQGAFFGEISFLDEQSRSARAIAWVDSDFYTLSREDFDIFASHHKKMAHELLIKLAQILSERLRYANSEIRALEQL